MSLSTSFIVELSRPLFPLELIQQIAREHVGDFVVNISEVAELRTTVLVRSVQHASESNEIFRQILTDAVIDFWEARQGPTERGNFIEVPPLVTDLTLSFTRLPEEQVKILITADSSVHPPIEFIRLLAPLRKLSRMTLESTNPLDRIVLAIYVSGQEHLHEVCQRLVTDLVL